MQPYACSKLMSHRYTQEYVFFIDALIDQGLKNMPQKFWLDIETSFKEKGYVRFEDNVIADVLFVHEDNRGGLGCNPYDVHRNLVTILKGGCNPKKLDDAVSIERAPFGKHREEQEKFNESLCANGYIAKPNGSERLCTLGCGHFGQAVKGTRAGVGTPEPYLADTDGHLSVDNLSKKDERYGRLCKQGWRHLVLPYDMQVAWPRLPMLVQKALNASNSVATQASEFETAVSMSEFIDAATLRTGKAPELRTVLEATEGSTACKGYVDKIAQFVMLYSGGKGAPAIKRMAGFHKLLGGSGQVGEAFMRALVDFKCSDPLGQRPLAREALMTAACTSKKVVNGVFILIGPNQIRAMLGHAQITEGEKMASVANELLEAAEAKGLLSTSARIHLWGALLTRWALLCTNTQAQSFENRLFENLAEIKGVFAADFNLAIGDGFRGIDVLCGWDERFAPEQVLEKGKPMSSPVLANVFEVDGLADPEHVLSVRGYMVDGWCRERAKAGSTFRITKIADGNVHLEEHHLFRAPFSATLQVAKFMEEFLPLKDFKPQVVVRNFEGLHSELPRADELKVAAFIGLQRICGAVTSDPLPHYDGPMQGALSFYANPKELRAAKVTPIGGLRLVPFTVLSAIDTKPRADGTVRPTITINGDKVLYLSAPPCGDYTVFSAAKGMMVPYWHVGTMEHPTMAKVVVSTVLQDVVVGGVRGCTVAVECLQNTVALNMHDVVSVQRAAGRDTLRARVGLDPSRAIVPPTVPRMTLTAGKGKGKGKTNDDDGKGKAASAAGKSKGVKANAAGKGEKRGGGMSGQGRGWKRPRG